MNLAVSRGKPAPLHPAGTVSGNGIVYAIPAGCKNHTVSITGTGTISSGVMSVEEAPSPDYTGTWSVITTINLSDVTGEATKEYHFSGLIRALRGRLSTPAGGGGSIASELTSY